MKLLNLDINFQQLKAYHDVFAEEKNLQIVAESDSGLKGIKLIDELQLDDPRRKLESLE